MENYVERNNFLNRLAALQKLCSDHDSNFPSALLFIVGPDGRNNKGSVTILKYLLRGSVSKDLFDETMEPEFEPLEEIILLVKQTSLSVVWSHEMKKLLSPLFQTIPFLVEYLSSSDEENEIDLIQSRKCCDFKRMMLESVKQGGGVGIPVPIGYDDIQDIETWPILQSFALDHVYCPTGFFTARYNVADITTHLDVLFHTVDGYYVENAIRIMSRSIAPHMIQAIGMLDASTAEQRMQVTADDVAGPLEILYDFGEMDSAGTPDESMKPVVLFGADTAQLGAVAGAYPEAWRHQQAGRALHVVMEGCEPSTGLRWCRTYFLQRGRIAASVDISNDLLIAAEESEGGDSKHSEGMGHHEHYHIDTGVSNALLRLEGLYTKLLLALRTAVKLAFSRHSDVLEAGTEIQTVLTALMKGDQSCGLDVFQLEQWRSLSLDSQVPLRATEQLQVHMDCLNALGEVVGIEDVDDMGGSCWTYIRVAVHGITVEPYGSHTATVAVGDTFLFSSHRSSLTKNILPGSAAAVPSPSTEQDRLLLLGDGCCVTHGLPYYRCLIGAGAEELSARRLLNCTRSIHLLSKLGLGKPLDYTGTGMLKLTMLTDHPLVPHFEADFRTFTEGLLVEKMDGADCLPLLLSIGQHVERVWTVDTVESMQQASTLLSSMFLKEKHLPDLEVPDGLLVIFRLKATDSHHVDEFNPLQRCLPLIGSTPATAAKHLALIIPSDSRAASAMTSACSQWRNAMRMYDVQEHRGGSDMVLPTGILRALLSVLDFWKEGVPNMVTATDTSGTRTIDTSSTVIATSNQALLTAALTFARHPLLQVPGMGQYAMRCMHAVSDAQRVSTFNFSEVASDHPPPAASPQKAELLVLVGHAGSGITYTAGHLATQWSDMEGALVEHVVLDFTTYPSSSTQESADTEKLQRFISHAMKHSKNISPNPSTGKSGTARACTLVSVVLSLEEYVSLPTLLLVLESTFQTTATAVMSMMAPAAALGRDDHFRYASKPLSESGYGLGFEYYRAAVSRDLLHPACCDLLFLVEDASTSSAATKQLKDTISTLHPTLPIVKLSPMSLRLDRNGLEAVQTAARAGRSPSSGVTERQACSLARGYPVASLITQLPTEIRAEYQKQLTVSHSECPGIIGNCLSTLQFTPASLGISEWNLQNILQTIQVLFPSSKQYTIAIENTWKAPPSHSTETVSRFKRVIELAKAKVMSVRQEEEGRHVYTHNLQSLCKPQSSTNTTSKATTAATTDEVLHRLIRGIRSIHGLLQLPSGTRMWSTDSTTQTAFNVTGTMVVIEANSSYTILRPTPSPTTATSSTEVGITIQGIFSKKEINFLTEIFKISSQYKLPNKELLTIESVTTEQSLNIQNMTKYSSQCTLPGNWWFDGHSYIDINGMKRLLRPDIDKLLALYIHDENLKIREYNEMLKLI